MIVTFNNKRIAVNSQKCHVFYINGSHAMYDRYSQIKYKNKSILCIDNGEVVGGVKDNRFVWRDGSNLVVRSDMSPYDMSFSDIEKGYMMCWINPGLMINDMRKGGDFQILTRFKENGKYSTLVNYCSFGSLPPDPNEYGMYKFVGHGMVDVNMTVNVKFGDKYTINQIRKSLSKSKFKNTNKYLPYRDK